MNGCGLKDLSDESDRPYFAIFYEFLFWGKIDRKTRNHEARLSNYISEGMGRGMKSKRIQASPRLKEKRETDEDNRQVPTRLAYPGSLT